MKLTVIAKVLSETETFHTRRLSYSTETSLSKSKSTDEISYTKESKSTNCVCASSPTALIKFKLLSLKTLEMDHVNSHKELPNPPLLPATPRASGLSFLSRPSL